MTRKKLFSQVFRSLLGMSGCLFAAAALPACAKTVTAHPDTDLSEKVPVEGMGQAQERARGATVTCNDWDCNPSVALLTAAQDSSVSMCTSFLIGPDLMATNSHCIPEDLKPAGSSCSGRMWVHFPSTYRASGYSNAEEAECAQVISATDLSKRGNDLVEDIAFIRLKKPVSRPALRISRGGFPDEHRFTITRMTPDNVQDRVSGTISTEECTVAQRSALLPSFDHPGRSLVGFKNCELVHGNSGSPMLNTQGEVIGIAQAYYSPSKVLGIVLREGGMLSESNRLGTLSGLKLGTNLACIELPESGLAAPVDLGPCQAGAVVKPAIAIDSDGLIPSPVDDSHPLVKEAMRRLGEDLEKKLAEAKSTGLFASEMSDFGWRLKDSEDATDFERSLLAPGEPRARTVYAMPSCLARPSRQPQGSWSFFVPTWEFRIYYNESLQLEHVILPHFRGPQAKMTWEAARFSMGIRSDRAFSYDAPFTNLGEVDLRACD